MTVHDTGVGSERSLPTVDLLGIRFHAVREMDCVEHILASLRAGVGGWVVTPNLDILRRLCLDRKFRRLCRKTDLVVADGMPLVWASRLQRTPLPERVAGSTLIESLSRAAGAAGRSIFLLGGASGTAERAASVLAERCDGLVIAGAHCPAPGFERDEAAVARIARMLAAARPDIVYVALGCPKQEYLIARLRGLLPGSWWMGVGISFSFLCGEVRRSPRWMQRTGLEWLHRLAQEPARLARRYLVDDLPFAARLFARSALARSALSRSVSHGGGRS